MAMMSQKILMKDNQARFLIACGLAIVLILLPFHGFLSTWIGSSIDSIELAKVWKEILLVLLIIPAALDMSRNPKLARSFFGNRLHQLLLFYGLFHLLHAAFSRPPIDALVVSALINTRFVLIFLLARWLMWQKVDKILQAQILRWVVVSLGLSALFALLQMFILPSDFLTYFGYGANTIPAEYTIDDNDNIRRVASLTRGPNVFGAMLVVLVALIAERLYAMRKQFAKVSTIHKLNVLGTVSVVLAGLFVSYSRSGWLAAAVGVMVIIWLGLPALWRRRSLVAVVPIAIVLIFAVASLASNSGVLSALLLHDSPDSGQVTSTEDRFTANRQALADVIDQPFGDGPGTAGPASFYNDEQTRIAENYYLQIGQEIGVIGVALFVGIISLTGIELYKSRKHEMSRVLLASLIGLSVAALFAHTWADEEVALLWWGLAGLYLPAKK